MSLSSSETVMPDVGKWDSARTPDAGKWDGTQMARRARACRRAQVPTQHACSRVLIRQVGPGPRSRVVTPGADERDGGAAGVEGYHAQVLTHTSGHRAVAWLL